MRGFTKHTFATRATQSGLTMVELMIAMVTGLILLAGILQIALNSRQHYSVQEAMSRTQEAGRFAMDILSRDIRMADFWGCVTDATKITNNLNVSGTGYLSYMDFAGGIVGTDGGTTLPDTITLSGALGTGIAVLPPYMPQTSAMLHVLADNGLNQGDIVLLSDCLQGDIFQISNSNPSSSGSVVHNTGNATEPGNYNPGACQGGNAHCLSKTYDGAAQIYGMQALTYSIHHPALQEPMLMRSRNGAPAVELVAGIENMKFLYGEDTTGDQVANLYHAAGSVSDWDAVVSVRIHLLARSSNEVLEAPQVYQFDGQSYTASDRRLRREFSSTVTIRNRAP
jgi:type IV pilus assembly protein PilW